MVLATVLGLLAALATIVVLGGTDSDDPVSSDAQSNPLDLSPKEPADDVLEVEFKTFEGDVVPLGTALQPGTPTVLNFFSKSCASCVREMPALQSVADAYGAKIAVFGLAVGDRLEEAKDIVRQTGISYDVGRDPRGDVMVAVGGTLLPTTAFFDGDGHVVEVHIGALTEAEFRGLIAKHLGVNA